MAKLQRLLFLIISCSFMWCSMIYVQDAPLPKYTVVMLPVDMTVSVKELEVPEPTTEVTTTEATTHTTTKPTTSVNHDDLWLLAHLIWGEAGSNSCSDQMQLYVGSVALNRVKSSLFPNTLKGVIYQKGQYTCFGNFYKEPNERTWNNARILIEQGSQLPSNVVFQSQFKQGSGVYCKLGNMYFCYL